MSFYDSASLAFLPSGGAGKDGKAYSIKPVPEYGNELITNGGFDTDSDWVKVSSTISGGTGNLNGTGVTSLLYQSNVLTQNKKYYLTFTISNYNGLGQLEVINNDGTVYYLATSNGNISIEFTHSIANQNFLFRARNSAIASIDNVSVKEVIVDGDFTFSRGSNLTATRVDSNGLIEKGRENLFTNSDMTSGVALDQITRTTGQADPFGGTDAIKITETTATGNHRWYKLSITPTGVFTASVYMKYDSRKIIRIHIDNGNFLAGFDILNGTVYSTQSSVIDAKIEAVGTDGWYRCSVTANGTAPGWIGIYMLSDSGANSYTGDGSSAFLFGFQLELGLVATDYIKTGASTGLAGLLEDSPRFDYSGGASCPSLLLEPSRTNVWKYTEYLSYSFSQIVATTITQNTTETLSPEGLYNATKLEGIGSWIFKDFLAGTDTGTWTVSCWVKAVNPSSNNTFRLSVSGNNFSSNLTATNDWQRFYFSVTNGGATAAGLQRDTSANDADLYIYGLQVEEGSYPTSYIPNHSGGSVTRNADNPAQLDVTNLTSTYNTLFVEFEVSNITNQGKIALSDNSQNNRMTIYQTTDDLMLLLNVGGSGQTSITASNVLSVGTNFKVIAKHQNGSHALFINGTKIGEQTSTTPTGLNKLRYGNEIDTNDSQKFLGNIKQTLVFPKALSNTDCEIITGTSYESFAAMATALNYTTYE